MSTDEEYEAVVLQRDAAIHEANMLYDELQHVRRQFHLYKKDMERKLYAKRGRRPRSKRLRNELDKRLNKDYN